MTDKNAYNNISDYIPREHPYNTDKWLRALREIKVKSNSGLPYLKAYELATQGWDKKEIRDFHTWVRFYEEQGHMKYTTANLYGYEGYYLPTSPVPSPVVVVKKEKAEEDSQPAVDPVANARAQAEERKKQILEHRKKILSRLQAARKLFTHEHGKQLAGENLNQFLDTLNELEKQIHSLQVSSSLATNLIIRQANILEYRGAIKSAEMIRRIADNLPGGQPPIDPTASIPDGGAVGNNNPADPALPGSAPEGVSDTPNDGLIQFLNLLNGEDPFEDVQEAEFDEAEDIEIDESKAEDELEVDDVDGVLVAKGQAAPVPPAPGPAPAPPALEAPAPLPEEDLEVVEEAPQEPVPDEVTAPKSDIPPSKDFDSLIDAAFSNLKVADIVKRLDDLSRIFKNREIARQLSIVDMMMDRLGLSSFFPSLAEATRSALESNQYCLVRIDEVKSRLSGALDTAGKSLHDMGQEHSIGNLPEPIDLMGKDTPANDPSLAKVKSNLDNLQKKDKLKKDLRRNIEDNALLEAGNKQKAEVADLTEELNQAEVTPVKPQPPVV